MEWIFWDEWKDLSEGTHLERRVKLTCGSLKNFKDCLAVPALRDRRRVAGEAEYRTVSFGVRIGA
jgi:hypothetical protein